MGAEMPPNYMAKIYEVNGQTYLEAHAGDVEFVDMMLNKLGRNAAFVETDKDWELIGDLIRWFIYRFPEESKEFKESLSMIRNTRANEKGYSKTKEIKYIAILPPRFLRIFQKFYPLQELNKSFMAKFLKKFPLFKIADR